MDKELLFRYIRGEAAQHEKEQVAEWLDADPAHMHEFMALRGSYDATLWRDAPPATAAPKSKARIFAREFLKIASVLVVAFVAAKFLIPSETKSHAPAAYQTLYVPEGQRAQITLADNTKVWLNAKSKLVFPGTFSGGERSVELTGEAYFDVTHNESKPFFVRTGDHDIKVLGTEFDVRSYPDRSLFEVSLIEGSVSARSLKTGQEVILSPNQKARDVNGQLLVSGFDNDNHLLWREGIIAFESETFPEILSKLELYYDAHIRISDQCLITGTYTGKFWINDGVEHVLKVLQLNLRFKYHKDNMNNIYIY